MGEKSRPPQLPAGMMQLIDAQVRPALRAHGGDLTITEFSGGVLRFKLTGGCRGCPSAWLTAEEIVKAPLTARFPELKDVVADTDLDDDLISMAKEILSQKHAPR